MYKQCEPAKRLEKIVYPINIDLAFCKKIECYPLHCDFFQNEPTKLKLVNTGSTALIRGSWPADRPCLNDGPMKSKYIFSQLHFHWGKKATAGGNHTIDGERQAMEMHVVFFKKDYIYPEVAKLKTDGELIVVYFMKFQLFDNHKLDDIIEKLSQVKTAGSECYLSSIPFSEWIPTFDSDFLMYRADIKEYPAVWFICRKPIGISENQVKAFQALLNFSERPIENFEDKCFTLKKKKDLWYVNPGSSQIATLLRPDYEIYTI